MNEVGSTRVSIQYGTPCPVPIVFTGLSVSREDTGPLSFADIRPPVRTGDLDDLEDGQLVAIIDGELNPRSVLLKAEVRRAIQRGVQIHGAASVGALRAFEMRESGMAGHGWVYKAYCAHRIAGADEIAVVYEPLSHRPLTVPLVNIRFCLDRLVKDERIARDEAHVAMNNLKGLRLGDRRRGSISSCLTQVFGKQRTETLGLATGLGFDIKKHDATELISTLRE